MKVKLLQAMLFSLLFFSISIAKDKYICAIGDMEDNEFTQVFATKEDCNKYCRGIATVCQATDESNPVDTQDLDF